MLQSFVITLREGIEAALAIAIVLAYLKRTGREELSRSVYAALFSAIAASIAGAVVFHELALNTDAYEGYVMVLGALLASSLVYFMWRASRGKKGEVEQKLARLMEGSQRQASWAVFLFVFLMVGREGVETVLFLSAVSLNTAAILSFAGGLFGLAAAVVFGVLFVRGAIRVNLRQFFTYTTAILTLVAAQLLISGLHELSEAHVLPSSTREMALVGPVVHNDAYFFIAILIICAVLFLAGRSPRPEPTTDQVGRAEWRLKVAEYQRQQRTRIWGGAAALLLCVILAVELGHERAEASPPASSPLTFQRGVAMIPTASLRDGRLHFFRVTLQGKTVSFMVLRTQPGDFKAAFDACGICRRTYFYQSGDNVICANCGAALYLPSIGQEGGCNPVPLRSTVQDAYVRVAQSDLIKEIDRF